MSRIAIIICIVVAAAIGVAGGALWPTIAQLWPQHQHGASEDSSGGSTWYQSQMHPWIIQAQPGNCPICGMDLTPVSLSDFDGTVRIEPAMVQNLGIRTAVATESEVERELRTVGTLTWEPNRVHRVEFGADGWLRELRVSPGERVQVGAVLAVVEAPEIDLARRDWRNAQQDGADAALARSAEARLRWLGVSFDETLPAGQALLLAPIDGIVSAADGQAGMRIGPGMNLITIVDDQRLWLELPLYPSQAAFAQVGLPVTIRLDHGRELTANLSYLEPTIDPQTRARRARIVLDNPDRSLSAGSWAEVRIQSKLDAPAVVVPDSAVLTRDGGHFVFLALPRGRFGPRAVTVGAIGRQNERVISSGLRVGDRVVVSGQFLLDSESRTQEALGRIIFGEAWSPGGDESEAAAAEPASPTVDNPRLSAVLDAYFATAAALYGNELANAQAAAPALAQAATTLNLDSVASQAEALVAAGDLAQARIALGHIGIALRDHLRQHGSPYPDLHLAVCGMAPDGIPETGVWLQRAGPDDDPRNPFFGARDRMRSCAIEFAPLAP